jgi:hypothetical protein
MKDDAVGNDMDDTLAEFSARQGVKQLHESTMAAPSTETDRSYLDSEEKRINLFRIWLTKFYVEEENMWNNRPSSFFYIVWLLYNHVHYNRIDPIFAIFCLIRSSRNSIAMDSKPQKYNPYIVLAMFVILILNMISIRLYDSLTMLS